MKVAMIDLLEIAARPDFWKIKQNGSTHYTFAFNIHALLQDNILRLAVVLKLMDCSFEYVQQTLFIFGTDINIRNRTFNLQFNVIIMLMIKYH